ncbi:hypothetical protein QF023_002248 [Chryseobacterium sp. SLBN-27]|uniref:hypothetical protein n=1 Tax=Chryseobacterium sp. SLBN-27 TaxID=3042287 RepID=UPI00285D082F|nr:hypothetical protein [Chryseobacterium sp. SLBN-27]MDR6158732.1 hypothetical protein [Chryseobacterium sp. SLBN-27]
MGKIILLIGLCLLIGCSDQDNDATTTNNDSPTDYLIDRIVSTGGEAKFYYHNNSNQLDSICINVLYTHKYTYDNDKITSIKMFNNSKIVMEYKYAYTNDRMINSKEIYYNGSSQGQLIHEYNYNFVSNNLINCTIKSLGNLGNYYTYNSKMIFDNNKNLISVSAENTDNAEYYENATFEYDDKFNPYWNIKGYKYLYNDFYPILHEFSYGYNNKKSINQTSTNKYLATGSISKSVRTANYDFTYNQNLLFNTQNGNTKVVSLDTGYNQEWNSYNQYFYKKLN